MTDMELYAVPIPEGGQTATGATERQQQQLQAILGSDSGDVTSVASEPGERQLTVEFVDEYANLRAQELQELANSLSQPLAYHAQTGTSLNDEWVAASQADVDAVDPRGQDTFQRATLTLSSAGTPASEWRAIRTAPAQVDHPFGNDTSREVGVPSQASKVRWLDEESGQREAAAVQLSRSGRLTSVDVYFAGLSSFDEPTMIYEIPLADVGFSDPRVWDDRGKSNLTDANGAIQWQKVFSTDHRYDGRALVTNGIVRVFFDEGANSTTVEEWDSNNSVWSSRSLGASDWELFDLDIREIGLGRVRAVVEFRDPTASPTNYHRLSVRLSRGYNLPLWANDIEGQPVPSGLQDLLDPVANTLIIDAQPQMGLVPREAVV